MFLQQFFWKLSHRFQRPVLRAWKSPWPLLGMPLIKVPPLSACMQDMWVFERQHKSVCSTIHCTAIPQCPAVCEASSRYFEFGPFRSLSQTLFPFTCSGPSSCALVLEHLSLAGGPHLSVSYIFKLVVTQLSIKADLLNLHLIKVLYALVIHLLWDVGFVFDVLCQCRLACCMTLLHDLRQAVTFEKFNDLTAGSAMHHGI